MGGLVRQLRKACAGWHSFLGYPEYASPPIPIPIRRTLLPPCFPTLHPAAVPLPPSTSSGVWMRPNPNPNLQRGVDEVEGVEQEQRVGWVVLCDDTKCVRGKKLLLGFQLGLWLF